MAIANYLSIDVEDYFQVSAFEGVSPPDNWHNQPFRAERNTSLVLDILAEKQTRATFFVLGWIARKCPSLVKKISAAGHEIASHGFGHRRVSTQDRTVFRKDVRDSKKILEDLSGQQVLGYRAPSYSISHKTLWAYDELHEAGYVYDSSVFPVQHDFYGIPDWPRFAFEVGKQADGDWCPLESQIETQPGMKEFPISTLRIGKRNLPIAGGGYFRLFPYAVTRWGLQRINKSEKKPFVFYLHPWEFDPQQPRMNGAGWKSNFRHYLNLHKTEGRFRRLLDDFEFCPIGDEVKKYNTQCV
jgi:polysaccharide deacetylase family protein (PEP-CTERM system associated)